MGAEKRRMMEADAEQNWFTKSPDTVVCSGCLSEEYLSNLARSSKTDGVCDFCEEMGLIIPTDLLMEKIRRAVSHEYDDVHNSSAIWTNGSYWTDEMDSSELLEDAFSDITEDSALIDFITDSLPEWSWSRRDPYSTPSSRAYAVGWNDFVHIIKHETRFFSSTPPTDYCPDGDTPFAPGEFLPELLKIVETVGMLSTWKAGSKIHRARQWSGTSQWRTLKDLGPPSFSEATQANRMSPPGIPMFYGALEPETALAEILEPGISFGGVSAGEFLLLRDLLILDLTLKTSVPSKYEHKSQVFATQ